MTQKATTLSACGELVRRLDSDRFLCALMAPVARRECFLTLLAFNQEIARIHTLVTEPVLGQMRLQWWREMIEGVLAGGLPPAHEIAQPLGALLQNEPTLAPHLYALLEARERDFEPTPFETTQDITDYARHTSAPLLAAMGVAQDEIATGYALVGLLRAGACPPALVQPIADEAYKLLQAQATGQARLWRALARLYLRQLEKNSYNVADIRITQPHPWRGLVILWAHLTDWRNPT